MFLLKVCLEVSHTHTPLIYVFKNLSSAKCAEDIHPIILRNVSMIFIDVIFLFEMGKENVLGRTKIRTTVISITEKTDCSLLCLYQITHWHILCHHTGHLVTKGLHFSNNILAGFNFI